MSPRLESVLVRWRSRLLPLLILNKARSRADSEDEDEAAKAGNSMALSPSDGLRQQKRHNRPPGRCRKRRSKSGDVLLACVCVHGDEEQLAQECCCCANVNSANHRAAPQEGKNSRTTCKSCFKRERNDLTLSWNASHVSDCLAFWSCDQRSVPRICRRQVNSICWRCRLKKVGFFCLLGAFVNALLTSNQVRHDCSSPQL